MTPGSGGRRLRGWLPGTLLQEVTCSKSVISTGPTSRMRSPLGEGLLQYVKNKLINDRRFFKVDTINFYTFNQ